MKYLEKNENGLKYIEVGEGEVLLLIHGLFGALSNWKSVIDHFSDRYRVIIPMLPIHDMPIKEANLKGLVSFLEKFINYKQISNLTLIGNSLGGHLSLIYALRHPENVKKIILTGSSGLFENAMGDSFPKRNSYAYIKEKITYTFFDPKIVTKSFVDEIFSITNDIFKTIRIIAIAKSAQRHNMAQELKKLTLPTLLIWGLNDTITPTIVAHDFHRLIPNSILRFIDQCCHAPMMEHPHTFNAILSSFLS